MIRDVVKAWFTTCVQAGFVAGLFVSLFACSSAGLPPSTTGANETLQHDSAQYVLMIDAGSRGSRIYIYRVEHKDEDELPYIRVAPIQREKDEATWVHKVEPGLSEYQTNPEAAGRSLEELISFAEEKLGSDPNTLAATPVYLMATGGMRAVPEAQQNQILKNVREYLQSTPFRFIGSEVISGQKEALFSWITVNYLLGRLGNAQGILTVGALELGGASTQIAFVAQEISPEDHMVVRLGGTEFVVYTRSYPELGQNKAEAKVNSPACYPKDYQGLGAGIGVGDYDACRVAILETLAEPCYGSACSLMGFDQPPISGEFWALSGYYYTASFFRTGEPLSISDLEREGRVYCATDWVDILKTFSNEKPKFLGQYCFSSAYIVTLLVDGYGFDRDASVITTSNEIDNQKLSWTLGAVLYMYSRLGS